MACNCKTSSLESNGPTMGPVQSFIQYTVKILVFGLSFIILPFMMLFIIWLLFDMIVLNKNIEMGKILNWVVDKTKRFTGEKDEDDDYEDIDDLTEDDVILLNAEDITDKIK